MAIIEATKPETMKELKGESAPQLPVAPSDELTARIERYYDGASTLQQSRHADWTETYMLYRDRVSLNRLTQRQSVNVPLMKETVRAVLAKTDELTDVVFESLSGDKQGEIFWNAYWDYTLEEDNFEVKDIVDKKQEALYGLSTMKLNLWDGRATFEVLEPHDVVFDRFADPSDIEGTAMYICHRNIFRSISQLSANPNYKNETINELRRQYAQAMGLFKAEQSHQESSDRNERLQQMGDPDTENPKVGESVLEVREHYIRLWDEDAKRLRIKLRVTAAGNGNILIEDWLENILHINFFPFVKWSDDIERTDMYPDGLGDVARTPNKVLNAFFSQLIENRTLRNFGMTFYDSTKGNGQWVPQTYEAQPFGWYPVAGNPNEVTKRVDIDSLDDSLNDMNFIIGMVERATAATATEKGVSAEGKQTLGEIQILAANANARITSISKFYNIARRELAEKWYMLCVANAEYLKPVKLYKKSSKGNMFEEEFNPKDWKDAVGYRCRVTTSGERDAKSLATMNKLQAISANFQGNPAFKEILQKRSLDLIDGLTAEDVDAVLAWEKQQTDAAAGAIGAATPEIPGANPVPSPIPTPAPRVPVNMG